MPASGSEDRQITRRHFVGLGGAGAAMVVFGDFVRPFGAVALRSDPFSLGVASGDPSPDGVVLWTRLGRGPLDEAGTQRRAIPVKWEVADDERFSRVVTRGEGVARPELGHSVHVEVEGLSPGREYFYRFTAGSHESPTGRTKTAPRADALTPLRFAVASCQHYEHGFYTAYRHMAREDLDVVFHLGDYIYEFGPVSIWRRAVWPAATTRPSPRPSRDTGTAMPSTAPIRTCKRPTPPLPGWSPGTTTR